MSKAEVKGKQVEGRPPKAKAEAPRVHKPDEAKFEKEKTEIENQISAKNAKFNELKSRVNSADSGTPGGPRRKELLEKRRKIQAQSFALKDEKEILLKKHEGAKKVLETKQKEAEEIRDKAAPYKSIEKIDQQVKEFEKKISTGGLKLIDEKKYVSEISNMKRARKNLEQYAKRNEELDKERQEIVKIKKELDSKSEEQKKVSDELKEIDAALDGLKKEAEEDKAKLTQLIEERNKVKSEIDELYEKKRQLHFNHKQQKEEFRNFQFEENQKRREAQQAQREKMVAEKKLEMERQRREQRLAPKFVEEIQTATTLIQFLSSTYKVEKPQAHEPAPEKKEEVAIEGMVALKKKGDRNDKDVYWAGKASSSKPQKKGPKGRKGTDAFKIPLEMVGQFTLLSVPIPACVADIEKTLGELKEKKEHYEKRQKEELEKAIKEEEEERENEAKAALLEKEKEKEEEKKEEEKKEEEKKEEEKKEEEPEKKEEEEPEKKEEEEEKKEEAEKEEGEISNDS